MVIIDAITRLQPNALGDNDSAVQDSFANGLLDYPHYTRPQEIMNMEVPKMLVNGNHKCILRWRLKQSLGYWLLRPDLLKNKSLNESELQLLNEYINEIKLIKIALNNNYYKMTHPIVAQFNESQLKKDIPTSQRRYCIS